LSGFKRLVPGQIPLSPAWRTARHDLQQRPGPPKFDAAIMIRDQQYRNHHFGRRGLHANGARVLEVTQTAHAMDLMMSHL